MKDHARVKQVAANYRLSPASIRRIIKNAEAQGKDVGARRLGGRILINIEMFDKWVNTLRAYDE